MNLLKIQDDLKNVSDQDLSMMLRSPSSAAPSYLVLSEIRRRKDMRTQAGDPPQTTVADDLAAPPQTYADAEGIRSLRVPGYEEEQQINEADSGAGIEAMRAGGIVRMADGGEVDLPPPPAAPAPGSAGINMQSIMQRNMELIPGIPQELMDRLRASRTDEGERRREAQRNALIEAGLRIAASNNPRLAGAIGEGATPALQSYNQQVGEIRRDQATDLQREIAAAQADIQRRYMAGQLSAAEYRSAMDAAGRREIAEMQIAAQRAQSGASDARADRRLQREIELETARRHGRGEYTPQEWEGLSEPQRQIVLQQRDTLRPRNADVSGLAPALATTERRLAETREQLRNLGPRPEPSWSDSKRRQIAEWDAESRRLNEELRIRSGQVETIMNQIMGGGRPRQGVAGNTTTPQPTFNYVEGVGAVPIR